LAHRLAGEGARVEVMCKGGKGRTGTALAGLAILDGLDPRAAVAWVRVNYHPEAVEAPWQRWWLYRLRWCLSRGGSRSLST
jgi:protein-tyrosine phosphatase